MTWNTGSSSLSQTLITADDILENDINQLRESNPPTAVVGTTPNCQYYCDGTADDVQIQTALNAVDVAGGGKIYIKAGTYLLSAPLVVGDYTHIQGDGMGATILKMANGSWEALLAEYFVTADLPTLNLKKNFPNVYPGMSSFMQPMMFSKHSRAGSGVAANDYSKWVTVTDITFDVNAANQTYRFDTVFVHAVGLGCGFYPAVGNTIQRVEIINFCGGAISMYGPGAEQNPPTSPNPNKILDCYVKNGGVGISGNVGNELISAIMVNVIGAASTIVSGNNISNCSAIPGIMTEDTNRIKITNNYIWNVWDGITLVSSSWTDVSNNYIWITGRYGIRYSGDNHHSIIQGNAIFYPGTYGIDTSFVECRNNLIAYAGDVGIYVTGSNNMVTNNHVYDPGQSDTATYKTGILIPKGMSQSLVADNFVIDDYLVGNNPKGVQTMLHGYRSIDLGGGRSDDFIFANNLSVYATTADYDLSNMVWGYSTYGQLPKYSQDANLWVDGLAEKKQSRTDAIGDDGTLDLVTAKAGFGMAQIGDGEEYGFFSFTSAGAVTLISNSANCVNTDTDTKFCIFDNGTNVRLKNRLGSAKVIRYIIWYS